MKLPNWLLWSGLRNYCCLCGILLQKVTHVELLSQYHLSISFFILLAWIVEFSKPPALWPLVVKVSWATQVKIQPFDVAPFYLASSVRTRTTAIVFPSTSAAWSNLESPTVSLQCLPLADLNDKAPLPPQSSLAQTVWSSGTYIFCSNSLPLPNTRWICLTF